MHGWRETAVWRISARTVREWRADEVPTAAAALSYYALLALVPGLYVTVLAAGTLVGGGAAREALLDRLASVAGWRVADIVGAALRSVSAGEGGTGALIGVAVFLFAAAGFFVHAQATLNRMWRVRAHQMTAARFLRRWVLSFLLVGAAAALLAASLAVSFAADVVRHVSPLTGPAAPWWTGGTDLAFTLLLAAAMFALVFRVVPDTGVSWRDALLGGAVTSVMFTLGQQAISAYLSSVSVGRHFGEGAPVVVLLVWVYYSAQVVLFGAEFTHAWAAEHGRGGRRP